MKNIIPGIVAVIAAVSVAAQTYKIEISDLDFERENSPDYSENTPFGKSSYQDWYLFILEYKVEAEDDFWLDNVEIEWNVLMNGEKGYILLNRTVGYTDVEEGDRNAVVYVRPKFVKRYAKSSRLDRRDLKLLVTIRVDGQVKARYHYPEREPPFEWWDRTRATSEKFQIKDYDLLARSETPFAPLDWDSFPYIISVTPKR